LWVILTSQFVSTIICDIFHFAKKSLFMEGLDSAILLSYVRTLECPVIIILLCFGENIGVYCSMYCTMLVSYILTVDAW